MMNCSYVIKNPFGKDIYIPAEFGLLNNDEGLRTAYEHSSDKNTRKIVEYITEKIEGSLSESLISSIVSENINNLDSIVHVINETIPQSGEYLNFEKALYKYFLENPEGLVNTKEALSSPITLEYFNNVSGILNQTSLFEQHSQIQADLRNLQDYGIYGDVLREMDKFLEAFKNHDKNNYNSNTLLANRSILGVFSANVENYTIYNEGDIFSMFMGLFKRAGNLTDMETLQTLLGDTDYFINTINAGNVQLSKFEQDLMADTKESIERVNMAIAIVAENLSGNDSLTDVISNLIGYLNPKSFLSKQVQKIERTSNYLNNEKIFETSFQSDSYNRFLESVENKLDDNFGSELTQWRNKYSFIEDNLTIGRDLVFFSEIGEYALLTEYYNQGDGNVYIRGMQREGRNNKYVSQILSKTQALKYRINEVVKDPYIENDVIQVNENLVEVSSPNGFKESVLKSLLKKGDTVFEGWVIKGIYNTHIVASPPDVTKIWEIPYNEITKFATSSLDSALDSKNWSSLNSLELIDNMNDISIGDKIKDSRDNDLIKPVIWATDESVYVERKGKLVPIKRVDVEAARRDSNENIESAEINKVKHAFSTTLNQNSKFSKFTDPLLARNGDYFITTEGEIGKIVHKESGKSVIMEEGGKRIVTSYKNLNVESFFADRPLITRYTPVSLRVNNSLIHTSLEGVDNPANYVKSVYLIPTSGTLKSMYLFPNNHANIGEWVPAKNAPTKGVKDVTHHMLKLISEKTGLKISEIDPHLEKDGKNFKKDFTGIEEVKGFSTLSSEIKKSLNPIKKGAQFRVYEGGGISSEVYTIIDVKGDKVITEVSTTTKNGQILTNQKIFDKFDLLAERNGSEEYPPHNSISNLFLRSGDLDHMVIAQVIKEDLELAELQEINAIQNLKKEMVKTFEPLDIAITEGTEGFQPGQKAKITTNKESGLTQIVLNTSEGGYSDLVHENLHIYLTLLRYNSLESYSELINKLTLDNKRYLEQFGDSDNIHDKEEFVVDELVRLSRGENNFLYDNLNSFMKSIAIIMEKHFGETYKFDLARSVTNPIEYLKTPMRTFYNINKKYATSPLYNMGLLAAEPFLREWMKRENIKIIC